MMKNIKINLLNQLVIKNKFLLKIIFFIIGIFEISGIPNINEIIKISIDKKIILINIEQINFEQFEKIRDKSFIDNIGQNSNIKVYLDKSKNIYYKIWNSNYYFAQTFSEAFKSGFYDDISSLKIIIIDNVLNIRGYGTEQKNKIQTYELVTIDRNSFFEIREIQFQKNKKYIRLFSNLIQKIKKTGYVYLDLHLDNLAQDENNFYIIDLESIVQIKNLIEQISPLSKVMFCSPKDYIKIIQNIVCEYENNQSNCKTLTSSFT